MAVDTNTVKLANTYYMQVLKNKVTNETEIHNDLEEIVKFEATGESSKPPLSKKALPLYIALKNMHSIKTLSCSIKMSHYMLTSLKNQLQESPMRLGRKEKLFDIKSRSKGKSSIFKN